MKKTSLILLIIAAMVFGSGIAAFAQIAAPAITIKAYLDHGVSLPKTNTILKCPGTMKDSDDPWKICSAAGSGIDFGTLAHTLSDGSQAGCFYGANFFIVFLYPAAWGGAGYTLNQQFTWSTPGFQPESLVFTPAYVAADKFCSTCPEQGSRPSGSTLGSVGPATGSAYKLIYNSGKPGLNRIIRAVYGIPPSPEAGKSLPFTGWKPVPLTQTTGNYQGTLRITITEL
ncbi:MAG: hypothetical protein ABIH91_00625 [Candidatus Omnitrophota bacterium]